MWDVSVFQWHLLQSYSKSSHCCNTQNDNINNKAICCITEPTDWFINHRMRPLTPVSLQCTLVTRRQDGGEDCWAPRVNMCSKTCSPHFTLPYYSGIQITTHPGETNKLASNSVSTLSKVKRTKILDFGLLQARRAIALCWKSMDSPSLKLWIKELSDCIGLERLTYITKGKRNDFVQLWEPYITIIESGNVDFTWKENVKHWRGTSILI